jgi:hypothetical protein
MVFPAASELYIGNFVLDSKIAFVISGGIKMCINSNKLKEKLGFDLL